MPPKKAPDPEPNKEEKEKKEEKSLERVVKTSLTKILNNNKVLKKNFGPGFKKQDFVSFVIDYVRTFSQAVHKGSILFNAFLLECLSNSFVPVKDCPEAEVEREIRKLGRKISEGKPLKTDIDFLSNLEKILSNGDSIDDIIENLSTKTAAKIISRKEQRLLTFLKGAVGKVEKRKARTIKSKSAKKEISKQDSENSEADDEEGSWITGLDLIKGNHVSYKFFSIGISDVIDYNYTRLWDKYFPNHPFQKDFPDIHSQAFTYYGKTYDTNFFNSLWMNYKSRQLSYIEQWLALNKLDFVPYFVQSRINNWEYTPKTAEDKEKIKELPVSLSLFIQQERQELGVDGYVSYVRQNPKADGKTYAPDEPVPVSESWLKTTDMRIVLLKYYYKILTFLDKLPDSSPSIPNSSNSSPSKNKKQPTAKKFSLAPLTKISNMYMYIDTTILYHMLINFLESKGIQRDSTILKGTIATAPSFKIHKETIWRSIFKLDKIHSLRRNSIFTYLLDTDGVSTSVHFRKKPKEEKEKLSPEELEKKILKKENARVIGIDPGRTNLISAVERLPGGILKKYTLTKSEYYSATGMNNANVYKRNRLSENAANELFYRKVSLKTTNLSSYNEFISNYMSVFDSVWRIRTTKKWLNERLRVYSLKQKFIANWINNLIGDGPDRKTRKANLTIAYGDAKFASTGKGEKPGPTSWLSKEISKKIDTVFVNEFNTTKKCNCCEQTLCVVKDEVSNEEVARRRNKVRKKRRTRVFNASGDEAVTEEEKKKMQIIDIRGLRWCPTNHTFVDRDVNAALNILAIFNSKKEHCDTNLDARPEYLAIPKVFMKEEKVTHMLRRKLIPTNVPVTNQLSGTVVPKTRRRPPANGL